MNLFANITHAGLKDCFIDDHGLLTFIVNENELGKAVGKKAFKVQMLQKATNRKIKIVEFNPDVITFVRNVIYPLKTARIEKEGDDLIIEALDSKNRGLLIGRAAQNLRNFETMVKRYFDINEMKVM